MCGFKSPRLDVLSHSIEPNMDTNSDRGCMEQGQSLWSASEKGGVPHKGLILQLNKPLVTTLVWRLHAKIPDTFGLFVTLRTLGMSPEKARAGRHSSP